MRIRHLLLAALFVPAFTLPMGGCGKVQMPHEVPGPPGSGLRDPRNSGPSTMSVAQQTTIKNQGMPLDMLDNDKGGKTWMYVRQSGGVFGEKETAELFEFDARGLLVSQRTEVRKDLGK
jgi:hypothetical protein